ncbi:ABC transporter permease [Chryseomicrobium sp. FSL W7-1435]|uniref:ABC transporter permease n=1 Tax=Chryseomicrobium sp. FSL W7-1435 TaxID=2921704 RepID=UPI003159A1F1
MRNLASIYGQRFQSYFLEVQKYMQFIISGHIAVVLLFVIGAAGYSYSEWLKAPPNDFPVFAVSAVVLTVVLLPNRPALLLKQADQYFFLAMESQMKSYLKPALRWSVSVVIVRSLVVLVILLPLLSSIGEVSRNQLLGLALGVVALAIWNVHTKFASFWYSEQTKWLDYAIRLIVIFGLLYMYLTSNWLFFGVLSVIAFIYLKSLQRKATNPFPFDRMIDSEQQRMQRFYQFANYFTEVPHVRSRVSRRSWADKLIKGTDIHSFLITRSFVRKDELFYMWVRLALLLIVVPFLSFSYVVVGLVVIFAFAIAIQTYQGLLFNQLFRMDMLYPQPVHSKEQAVIKLARKVSYLPLVISAVIMLLQHSPLFTLAGVLFAVISIEWYFLRKKKQSD